MILLAPKRALVVLLSLLLIASGPAMALADAHGAAPGTHGPADMVEAGHDCCPPSDLQADCGADHCSPGLFPRFTLAEPSTTRWLDRPMTDLQPSPVRSFYKPPRARV